MSKKQTTPKRVINRKIFIVVNKTGGSADIVLRDNGDPVTLIRTLIQAIFSGEAVGATGRNMFVELWRKDAQSGSTLPTQTVSGQVQYAGNPDLLWIGIASIMRETTGEGNSQFMNIDMKGMRKLSRGEDLVLRWAGDTAVIMNAILTTFYKEA